MTEYDVCRRQDMYMRRVRAKLYHFISDYIFAAIFFSYVIGMVTRRCLWIISHNLFSTLNYTPLSSTPQRLIIRCTLVDFRR